jgi:hypothetical protein
MYCGRENVMNYRDYCTEKSTDSVNLLDSEAGKKSVIIFFPHMVVITAPMVKWPPSSFNNKSGADARAEFVLE